MGTRPRVPFQSHRGQGELTMGTRETFDQIRDTIQKWLADVTSLDVVFAEQSDPRPRPPYVAFKMLTGLTKVGSLDEMKFDADANTFRIKGQRRFTVSIQAVGRADGPMSNQHRASDI